MSSRRGSNSGLHLTKMLLYHLTTGAPVSARGGICTPEGLRHLFYRQAGLSASVPWLGYHFERERETRFCAKRTVLIFEREREKRFSLFYHK